MRLKALLLGLAVMILSGACTEEVKPVGRLAYTITRTWSNGMVEKGQVYTNGALIMSHGDFTERIMLPPEQLDEIKAAAKADAKNGVMLGSNSDDPVIGIKIGSGEEVRPAALTEGSLAALLNLLLDSHTLHP